MTKSFDYTTYLSPFTWRYGSEEMRTIWSEENKRKLWRQIWVTLAKAQQREGLVTPEELHDLERHQFEVDIEKSHEIEKEIHHDLMAEIKVFAAQAPLGGGKIHLGATSMDIEDNADALREKDALILIETRLKNLLAALKDKIETYKTLSCMGYTHLQPAEPTTLGYRFAFYAQDLLEDLRLLRFTRAELKGKGIKGAVGTSASYTTLLEKEKVIKMEAFIMEELGLSVVPVASQTAPRKFEQLIGQTLASIATSLHKFAFDLRIMQSPGFGELQEPFGAKQVGSSAMPFKKNPIKSEQICSLARLIQALSQAGEGNASHMLLERTLDDSANRRVYLPELFLATDDILKSATAITKDLVINTAIIQKNLATYGPFAATERVMMEAVKKGANRQDMHEVLREHAMTSWKQVQLGNRNPLPELLEGDDRITSYIKSKDLSVLMDASSHIGLASNQCDSFLHILSDELSS